MANLTTIQLGSLNKASAIADADSITTYTENIVSADGVALGKYSKIENENAIAIGLSALAQGTGHSIAIGCEVSANDYGVAIGEKAYANLGIALGADAKAYKNTSIALGRYSQVSAEFAAQINGDIAKSIVNEEDNTLKFYNGNKNVTVVDANGDINASTALSVDVENIDGTKQNMRIKFVNGEVTDPEDGVLYFTVQA